MEFIVCFEKPVLRMGLQIETISTFLPTLFKPYGLKKPTVSRVVVYLNSLRKETG